ncbi:(Fe-S)-binding protein [Thermodesulfobacteriota bacterium]
MGLPTGCNPRFESVHCTARLHEHVGAVSPYLNAVPGGTQYFNDPQEVMFHHHGRIIEVEAREIAINALKDEQEADRILEWLKSAITQTWENCTTTKPCQTGKTRPKLMEIFRLLPKTNCRKCGQPTCMVFAAQVADGGRGVEFCPELSENNRMKLSDHLAGFGFD